MITPLKFNIALEKLPGLNRKVVFQPPFSGAMLNFRGVLICLVVEPTLLKNISVVKLEKFPQGSGWKEQIFGLHHLVMNEPPLSLNLTVIRPAISWRRLAILGVPFDLHECWEIGLREKKAVFRPSFFTGDLKLWGSKTSYWQPQYFEGYYSEVDIIMMGMGWPYHDANGLTSTSLSFRLHFCDKCHAIHICHWLRYSLQYVNHGVADFRKTNVASLIPWLDDMQAIACLG